MHILVNGKSETFIPGLSVEGLLEKLGYTDHFVAVAINSECVLRRHFATHEIKASDEIEILAPMAGG